MEQNVHMKEWLTPLELEQEFGIKVNTQNRMRMAGRLPYSKVGKFVRYSRTRINQLFSDADVATKSATEQTATELFEAADIEAEQ